LFKLDELLLRLRRLLECYLSSTVAQIKSILPDKFHKILETGGSYAYEYSIADLNFSQAISTLHQHLLTTKVLQLLLFFEKIAGQKLVP